jgi:2-amino-4-hydroxy-6-hydroxymethyldihydropteridine diphosphokinase
VQDGLAIVEPSLVIVALGSNLGDSEAILNAAFLRLEALSIRPILRSSLWESAPIDCPPGSPTFLNAVAGLFPAPEETPLALLRKLQDLERAYGRRQKTRMNEPRQLDLDLICFGDRIENSPELILPHPRAYLRAFVLAPLDEIAADLILPGQANTAHELLRDLGSSQLVRRVGARAV